MKKYLYILLLFLGISALCLAAGYGITRMEAERETAPAPETSAVPMTETARDSHMAEEETKEHDGAKEANGLPENRYYLVAEDGFLLVFPRDGDRVCMYTHVPVTDFPEEEQEQLRAGIWFSSMLDIFNYLESYTS